MSLQLGTMLGPIPYGVLTRHDDPTTPEDERLHDGNSRDSGVRGNIAGYPVVSCFAGRVVTAGPWGGYGLTVRVEGHVVVPRVQLVRARRAWPLQQLEALGLLGPDSLAVDVRMLYGHHRELFVKVGQEVGALQPLGGLGNTGKSTAVHLHTKLRLVALQEPLCFVDPLPLFVYASQL